MIRIKNKRNWMNLKKNLKNFRVQNSKKWKNIQINIKINYLKQIYKLISYKNKIKNLI